MKTKNPPANPATKPAARSTSWGTSHFESRAAAVSYYAAYESAPTAAVNRKLAEGQIHISPPALKPGQTLSIHATERRYFITETAFTSEERAKAHADLCAMYGQREWTVQEVETQARYNREAEETAAS